MGPVLRHFYEFGPFRVDPGDRTLFREENPVPLPPKTFDMLLVLVENRGRVLSKSDLLNRVWPDAVVEEANLSHHVFALRKALGDDKQEGKYIETVPRRGYRFTAVVRESHQDRLAAEETRHSPNVADDDANFVRDRNLDGKARAGVRPRFRELLRKRALLALALMIATAAMGGMAYFRSLHRSEPAPIRSIAVLPFRPLVPDNQQQALELGFADTLITKLSGLHGISVRPIGAVRRYTAFEQDPVEAGRQLRVDAVLDGSIQRAGERLRVSVRFVRVEDALSLWNGTFDEKAADIFAVQDAVTVKVVSSLSLQLSAGEQQYLAKRETHSVAAYNACLLGRYFANKRTADGFSKGIEYFRDALRVDPAYALAYSGIADAFSARGMYGDMPPKDAFEQAKAAAVRAVELDSSLAEAHVSLGLVLEWHEWDFAAAEREYRLGLELNPGYATGHQRYGFYLNRMGRVDEAQVEFNRALSLDPLSAIANTDAARPFYRSRDYHKAAEQLRKAIQIDDNFHRAHAILAHCYVEMGRFDEAIFEARRALELLHPKAEAGSPEGNYQIAYIEARAGRTHEAQLLLESLDKLRVRTDPNIYSRALAYAALGNFDRAFSALEELYRSRNPELLGIASDPAWDSLRAEPRFKDMLRRIGLAP